MASIETQLLEAKRLEEYIDAQSGGPGRGWYRIAYSGNEARRIINSGQHGGRARDRGRRAVRLRPQRDLHARRTSPRSSTTSTTSASGTVPDRALRQRLRRRGDVQPDVQHTRNFEQTGFFIEARACAAEGYRYTPKAWRRSPILGCAAPVGAPGHRSRRRARYPFVADCNSAWPAGPWRVPRARDDGARHDHRHRSHVVARREPRADDRRAARLPGRRSGHSGPLAASQATRRTRAPRRRRSSRASAAWAGCRRSS